MSETDGFKLAMELSKKEATGGSAPKRKKVEQPKPTPAQTGNFQEMAMSTAGFQKILE